MLLSVTESAKAVGCARSTVYDKINDGTLSRGAGGKIDTAELLRVFGELKGQGTESAPIQTQKVDIDLIAVDLLEIVREKDQELSELRADLKDSNQRLNEHRDAARALMSPDEFEEKLKREADRILEKERQKHSAEWEAALAERQGEIQEARNEAAELRTESAELRIRRQEELKQSETLRRQLVGIESRGFIARLFNRKTTTV